VRLTRGLNENIHLNYLQKICFTSSKTGTVASAIITAVNSHRSALMVRKSQLAKVSVSRDRIMRTVASSSAIETGEHPELIEKRLKSRARRFAKLKLAS